MEFQDYRQEMKYLRDYLNEQGYLYYVLDAPVIPDYEYVDEEVDTADADDGEENTEEQEEE